MIHSTPPPSSSIASLFLARRLLSVLCERVCWVRAQSALGLIRCLVCALGRCTALVVDVAGGLAGLRVRLLLGLGGLTASVGSRHV
jgi:hypothetical protein